MNNLIEKKIIFIAVSIIFILSGCGGGDASTDVTSSSKTNPIIPHSGLNEKVVLPTSTTENGTVPHSTPNSNIVLPTSTTENDNIVPHSISDSKVILPTSL